MFGLVMSVQRQNWIDPLVAGFFNTSEAARLVGVSQTSVRGWLNGYPNSKVGPILKRDFAGTRTVSFLDLIELRFVKFFRGQGVQIRTLRRAVDRARVDWQVTHPLAMSKEKFMTDRRTVFAQAAEGDDPHTWDMATGQKEMWTIIENTIAKGVIFDPSNYCAISWKPKPVEFHNVIIDPHIAFGRPTIEGTKVPTSTIFCQWMADQSKERVAEWFNISVNSVSTAIDYEVALAA